MKTVKITFMFISFLLATSCENISNIGEELVYEELLIVNGQISGGDLNPEISFTKTLPLNEEFDIKKAELKDVTAYIKTEDKVIYPLEYKSDGIYKSKYKLEIISGKNYELFALVNDTRINGMTKAPAIPNIFKAELINDRISCEIIPQNDEVYSCVYVLTSNQYGNPQVLFREKEFFSVEGPFNEQTGLISIKSGTVPLEYQRRSNEYSLAVEVYAWDKSYKKYFETKNNNKPIDDVFSQGGGAINWNITGENVIGLFIGYSSVVHLEIGNY